MDRQAEVMALIERMKDAAQNPSQKARDEILGLSDELMLLYRTPALPSLEAPKIAWFGNTMVVGV